jgi:hypothetical protein
LFDPQQLARPYLFEAAHPALINLPDRHDVQTKTARETRRKVIENMSSIAMSSQQQNWLARATPVEHFQIHARRSFDKSLGVF